MSERDRVIAVTKKYHGLGNRVRVTLGCASLAEWAGRRFSYVWPTGPAFGARFDELWEYDAPTISTVKSRVLTARHPYRTADLDWFDAARRDHIWQIRTPHAINLPEGAVPWGQRLQELSPAADVAERVRAIHSTDLANAPYVGVMVRAHDVSHSATLQQSPISWYLERMERIAEERPGIRFFVSADTVHAQREVIDRFPTAVAQTDKGAYNSGQALRSAVVDLYLLASAGHLLGPHYSSFPELAQQLAGDRLRLETSQTGPEAMLHPSDVLEMVANPLIPRMQTFR